MAVLDEVAGALAGVAEKVGPSVVRIGGGWRGGSGVVIGKGAVLTNAHNVRGDEVTVVFADGRRAGQLSGIDVDGDLAVVSVDTGSTAPSMGRRLGDDRHADLCRRSQRRWRAGDLWFRVERCTRVSRPRGRRISGSVEHTAPLAPGSSGSPLVDGEGRLLGLNTNRLGGGFYLALPADEALRGRSPRCSAARVPSGRARDRHRAVMGRAADAPRGRPARSRGRARPRGRAKQPGGSRRHPRGRHDLRGRRPANSRAGRCLRRARCASAPARDSSCGWCAARTSSPCRRLQ